MNASVVILTANRMALLRACLESLRRQTLPPAQIVVVDNGSTDETPALLAAWRGAFTLTVLRREASAGSFAEARNAGVAAATASALAMIDDDCEADPRWLERLLERLSKWQAVGGTTLPADDYGPPDTYSPELAWAVGLTPPGFFGPLGGSVVLPQAANLAFRRELLERHPFQQLGEGFTEDGLYLQGREDAEWWRRLRAAGVPCGVEPRALAWHRIPGGRYQPDAIRERVAADGVAHWRRERPVHGVRFAASDVLGAPAHFLHRAMEPHVSATQAWQEAMTWAHRQRAFLRAAVDDTRGGIAPAARSLAYARAARTVAGGLARALVRRTSVPLWEAVRSRRRLRFSPERPPRRILAVLHPFLGDAVLALPLLRQMAECYPETELRLGAGSRNAHLLAEQLPRWKVDTIPAAAVGRGPRAQLRLRQWVRERPAEAILLIYLHGLAALPFLRTDAPVVGWPHDNGLPGRLWGELLDVPVEKRWDCHEAIGLLNLGLPFGVVPRAEVPKLEAGETSDAHVSALLERLELTQDRLAVLHVDAATEPKYWRPPQAAQTARLCREWGLRVLTVGGKGGRGAAEAVRSAVPESTILNGKLNSAELGALYRRATLAIGPDSGPQHVAAAAGCPSVVLFGPTDERRWGTHPMHPAGAVQALRGVPFDWTAEERAAAGEETMVARIGEEAIREAIARVLPRGPQGIES